MSIILELKYEFITIMTHSDSDDWYHNMREATVDVVASNGIGPDDFVDEYEYHTFIDNLHDQAERSVKMEFVPTLKLVGLVQDLIEMKGGK
jgi:hypothetical protein